MIISADKLCELLELVYDCSVIDWNGYNAVPLDKKSIKYAIKVLEMLKFPYYDCYLNFIAEPDGILGLQWNTNNIIISIGVDKNGIMTWCVINKNGDEKTESGTETSIKSETLYYLKNQLDRSWERHTIQRLKNMINDGD